MKPKPSTSVAEPERLERKPEADRWEFLQRIYRDTKGKLSRTHNSYERKAHRTRSASRAIRIACALLLCAAALLPAVWSTWPSLLDSVQLGLGIRRPVVIPLLLLGLSAVLFVTDWFLGSRSASYRYTLATLSTDLMLRSLDSAWGLLESVAHAASDPHRRANPAEAARIYQALVDRISRNQTELAAASKSERSLFELNAELEKDLSELTLRLASAAGAVSVESVPTAPYKGPESYEFADHLIFTGRDAESDRVMRLVTIYRCAMLYGPQGVGKSSLINAGLLPRALAAGFNPDRIRVQPREGAEIAIIRSPAAGGSFLGWSGEAEGSEARLVISLGDFEARLRSLPKHPYPLLIFDQFEELISQFEEALTGDARQEALRIQKEIIDTIVRIALDPDLRVKILFVFRQDYLAQLGKMISRIPNLAGTGILLEPLEVPGLKQAVRGPFEKLPGRYQPELSPALAEKIIDSLVKRAGRQVNLSELQIVCLRLWSSGNPDATFLNRGIDGLLHDYYTEQLSRVPPELTDAAADVLSCLVTDSGVRNIVSRDDLIALAARRGSRCSRLEAALGYLENTSRLIRRERRGDLALYELVTESLIPWIREQGARRRLRAQRRKWARAVAGAAFIAVLAWVGAASVVSYRTVDVLEQENVKRLREEAHSTRTALSRASDELQTLKARNQRLTAELQRMQKALTTASRENAFLRKNRIEAAAPPPVQQAPQEQEKK